MSGSDTSCMMVCATELARSVTVALRDIKHISHHLAIDIHNISTKGTILRFAKLSPALSRFTLSALRIQYKR